MINKNKNKAMYLDLTDDEIKQYVEGGYIVEEDGPEDPPKAQDGIPKVKQRRGVRKNPDGTVSSHLMRAELVDGNWVGFPSLFQDSKPYADDQQNWVDMSEEKDWRKVYEEAKRRGEVYNFGKDKEAALAFGKGSWKDQLSKKHKGGEPHNHPHALTVPNINPWGNSNAFSFDLSKDMLGDLDDRLAKIENKYNKSKKDFELIRLLHKKRRQLQDEFYSKKQKTGKKYELLKPMYNGEMRLDFLLENEYNDQVNSIWKKAKQAPALKAKIKNMTPRELNTFKNNSKEWLKDVGYYVSKNKDGLYGIYDRRQISEKIYNHGMSPRKIVEDLGIGTKDEIEKDFSTEFKIHKNDHAINTKNELTKLLENNPGMSKKDAVRKLVNDGWGDVRGINSIYDTELNEFESKSQQLKYQAVPLNEKYDYITKNIKNIDLNTIDNKELKSFYEKVLTAHDEETEIRENLKLEEDPNLITLPLNYEPEVADETSGIGMQNLENQFHQDVRDRKRADTPGAFGTGADAMGKGLQLQEFFKGREDLKYIDDEVNIGSISSMEKYLRDNPDVSYDFGVYMEKKFANDKINKLENEKKQAESSFQHTRKMAADPNYRNWYNSLDDDIAKINRAGVPTFNALEGEAWEQSTLNPKFHQSASIKDIITNPWRALQYSIQTGDVRNMHSNTDEFYELLDKQKAAGLDYDGSYANVVERDDDFNVANALYGASELTPWGQIVNAPKYMQRLFGDYSEGSLSKLKEKINSGEDLTFMEDYLPTIGNALGVGFGAAAARSKTLGKFDGLGLKYSNPWTDDLLPGSGANPDGWLKRNIINPTDKALSTIPGYQGTKGIIKDVINFDDTPLPGTNLGKDAKSLYNLSSSLGSDAVEHGKDIYNVLKADSWKLPKQVATGVGLTYVPESAESLIANIKDENYLGAGEDAVDLGLAFTPGALFKNVKSTGKAGYDFLKKGLLGEKDYMMSGIRGLGTWSSRPGNWKNKIFDYGKDIAKTGYHGSVIGGAPWALGAGYNLATDKDATTSQRFEDVSKVASIFPGIAGAKNAKYIFMGGTQFLSDPTDPTNITQSILEGTGVGRYGKFGNTTGKFGAKVYDYLDEEDEIKVNNAINTAIIQDVENEDVENEDVLIAEKKKKKKKRKSKKTVRRIRGKKIYEDGGEIDETIELYLDPSQIQEYLLGGFVVEEI